jgi:hypothetical protein
MEYKGIFWLPKLNHRKNAHYKFLHNFNDYKIRNQEKGFRKA